MRPDRERAEEETESILLGGEMIEIVPLGISRRLVSNKLASDLERVLKSEVIVLPEHTVPGNSYDSTRGQCNSTIILDSLNAEFGDRKSKRLAVVAEDLFVPVFAYLFGEARRGGADCVLSTFRLREKLYGRKRKPGIERVRLLKESMHELGHTFGLGHCDNSKCVMFFSMSVEDVDRKNDRYCSKCGNFLARSIADFESRILADKKKPA